MTYCVGMKIDRGLVFMSDTRTNAGLDNISVFSKMRSWSEPGERVIVLLSAGNLATTQAVASLLEERMKAPADRHPSVFDAPSMFQVARLVGDTVKEVIQNSATGGQNADAFGASFILGGQIKGGQSRLFYIYPEGNFIESSADTPFFQIGENKYGKPILVRAYQKQMSFEEAVKLLLVSFDSTLKANLSVGLPLDMEIYEAYSFETGARRRFEATDPYYQTVSESWSEALKSALEKLPPFSFDDE
ncbi:proteasome-type protease [Brucella cytisi]|uniref:proteasome-type protease n=1 Tax=Brucella cytisi TaxID=407152 RepID=UPI00169B3589|nr:proteasome-type protease [Brucella cytisi]